MREFDLHSRLHADTVFVADWTLSRVLAMNDARYPWVTLVPRVSGATEIFDLSPAERTMLMEEIARAGETLKTLSGAAKINIGALGNLVPQLHVHVVARNPGDAAWPGPVWGQGVAVAYQPSALENFVRRFRKRALTDPGTGVAPVRAGEPEAMQAEAANSVADKSQVIAALRQASAATGSDFHYLLGTAMRESGLKTQAKSNTSSACGLFQFVGQTWLGLIKESGAKYGLGAQANAISKDGDGHFQVADSGAREAILALRKDPRIAALMAGEFSNKTKAVLENTLGRNVCGGELYVAHFLGPAAACKLIQMSAANPDAKAANAFPQAADANRNVFYHSDGSAKSVREVYNWALKQPAGDEPLRMTKVETPRFNNAPDTVPASDLLTSVLAWSPQRPSYSALEDDGDSSLPVTPFLLTPGVMDILSQVAPSHRQ